MKNFDSKLWYIYNNISFNCFTCRSGYVEKLNWVILCEVLRAAFNITLALSECSLESALQSCSSMVETCCQLVKFGSKANYSLPEDIVTPVAHFMVNMPKKCLENLCPLIGSDSKETFFEHPRFYQVCFQYSKGFIPSAFN